MCTVMFHDTRLAGADFSGVDLGSTQFRGSDISGADFRDAYVGPQLLKDAIWRRSTPPLLPAHLEEWFAASADRFRERVMAGDRGVYDHEQAKWPERKLARYPHLQGPDS